MFVKYEVRNTKGSRGWGDKYSVPAEPTENEEKKRKKEGKKGGE